MFVVIISALYGKPYIAAAKDTWRLFKDRGVDALINDSLVGMGKCQYYCALVFNQLLTIS